jgi:hypothetical protein
MIKEAGRDGECADNWLEEMTKQLGNGFRTSVAMRTLVDNNLGVLVKHVNQDLIQTFIELIAAKGPQENFLNFLQAVASCKGNRIAQNQERLLRAFYSSKNFLGECRTEDLRHRKEFVIETVLESDGPRSIYHSLFDKATITELLACDSTHAWKEHKGTDDAGVIMLCIPTEQAKKELPGLKESVPDYYTTDDGKVDLKTPTGLSYYKVTCKTELEKFESALLHGFAKIDRGHAYIGKDFYLKGMARVLVQWHVSSTAAKPFPKPEELFHCPKPTDPEAEVKLPTHLSAYYNLLDEKEKETNKNSNGSDLAWVGLQQLVWVLDPETLWHKVACGCSCVHPETGNPKNDDGSWYCDGTPLTSSAPLRPKCNATPPAGMNLPKAATDWQRWTGVEAHLDAEQRSMLACQVQLARYYKAQLDLFSELCLDANGNSIEELESHFSFEVCFNALRDPLLPNEIRGSMATLMTNLHIRRSPHRVLRLPQTTRRSDTDVTQLGPQDRAGAVSLTSNPTLGNPKTRPLARYDDADYAEQKFRLLVYFSSDFLTMFQHQQYGNVPRNTLVTKVLSMIQSLGEYGFFSTAEMIRKMLLQPLLGMLDGRSDKPYSAVKLGDSSTVSEGNDRGEQHSQAGDAVTIARKALCPETLIYMDGKAQMLNILAFTTECRVDYRLSKFLHGWVHIMAEFEPSHATANYVDKIGCEGDFTVRKLVRAQIKLVKYGNLGSQGRMLGARKSSINVSSQIPTKEEKAERHEAIGNVSVHFFRALFDDVFKSTISSNKTVINLDFAYPNMTTPFVPIIMDLMMHEHAGVCGHAFNLLVRHHSQQLTLFSAVMDTQLIVRDERKKTLKLLREFHEQLAESFEYFSVWAMGNWPLESNEDQIQKRKENEDKVINAMHQVADNCRQKTGEDPAPWALDMLRGLDFHHVIVRGLRINSRRTDDLKDDATGRARKARVEEHNAIRLRIHSECFAFMRMFVSGHKKNQEVVHSLISPYLVEALRSGVHDLENATESTPREQIDHTEIVIRDVIDTCSAIFVGNAKLIRSIPLVIWTQLGAVAPVSRVAHERVLRFYCSVVSVDGMPLLKNQVIVLKTLTQGGAWWQSGNRNSPINGFFEGASKRGVHVTPPGIVAAMAAADEAGAKDEQGLKYLVWLIQRSQSLQSPQRVWDLEHYISELELRTELCRTKASRATRAKCQSFLPLPRFEGTIGSEVVVSCPPLMIALLRFLTAVHCGGGEPADFDLTDLWHGLVDKIQHFADSLDKQVETVAAPLGTETPGRLRAIEVLADKDKVRGEDCQFIAQCIRSVCLFLDQKAASSGNFGAIVRRGEHHQVKVHKALFVAVKRLETKLTKLTQGAARIANHFLFLVSQPSVGDSEEWFSDVVTYKSGEYHVDSLKREHTMSATSVHMNQEAQSEKFGVMCAALQTNILIRTRITKEFDELVEVFENAPAWTDPGDRDYLQRVKEKKELHTRKERITFQQVTARLIAHFQQQLDGNVSIKHVEFAACFRVLRRLVERTMEQGDASFLDPVFSGCERPFLASSQKFNRMYVEAKEDMGDRYAHLEEDMREAHRNMQVELADLGAVRLVISLVETAETEATANEAMQLAVRLLEFGNVPNQRMFLSILRSDGNSKFLARIRQKLRVAREQIKSRKKAAKAQSGNRKGKEDLPQGSDEDVQLVLICRFIQLLCEGHNHDLQDFMREQVGGWVDRLAELQ